MMHADEAAMVRAALHDGWRIRWRGVPVASACWCGKDHGPFVSEGRATYIAQKWADQGVADYGTAPTWGWLEKGGGIALYNRLCADGWRIPPAPFPSPPVRDE